MTRRLVAVAAAVLVVGCYQRKLATSDMVVTPDGTHGWTVTCRRADYCYQLAGQDCPDGYRIIDSSAQEESSGRYLSTLGTTSAQYRSGTYITLLIACRNPDD